MKKPRSTEPIPTADEPRELDGTNNKEAPSATLPKPEAAGVERHHPEDDLGAEDTPLATRPQPSEASREAAETATQESMRQHGLARWVALSLFILGLVLVAAGVFPFCARTYLGPDEWQRMLQAQAPWIANVARVYAVGAPLSALGLIMLWMSLDRFAVQRIARHAQTLSAQTAATDCYVPNEHSTACPICKKQLDGIYCNNCGAVVSEQIRLIASVFMIQHRTAIIGALATIVFGSLVTFTWQSTHEYWQAQSDANERRHKLAEKATTHLAMFRSALWEFSTDCIQRKLGQQERGEPSANCEGVYKRILDGYVNWAWVVPDFIGEVKASYCADVRQRLASSDGPRWSLNIVACELLQCDLSMQTVSNRYIEFVNAYAHYVRCGTPKQLQRLGEAQQALESVTLRLGCAATIAAYRGADKEHHSDTTGYCSADFVRIGLVPNDLTERRLWCERELQHKPEVEGARANECHGPIIVQRDWDDWFKPNLCPVEAKPQTQTAAPGTESSPMIVKMLPLELHVAPEHKSNRSKRQKAAR